MTDTIQEALIQIMDSSLCEAYKSSSSVKLCPIQLRYSVSQLCQETDPVSSPRDHDRPNVRVRVKIFDQEKLINCRICNQNCHYPFPQGLIEIFEKRHDLFCYGKKPNQHTVNSYDTTLTSNMPCTASMAHRHILSSLKMASSRSHKAFSTE